MSSIVEMWNPDGSVMVRTTSGCLGMASWTIEREQWTQPAGPNFPWYLYHAIATKHKFNFHVAWFDMHNRGIKQGGNQVRRRPIERQTDRRTRKEGGKEKKRKRE